MVKKVSISSVEYLGGNPRREKSTTANLTMSDEGLSFKRFKTIFDVDVSEISNLSVEGPEQVAKRVTVTRLLATGLFAFALKKKQKESYIIINLTDGTELVFKVEDETMKLRAKLTGLASFYSQQNSLQSHPSGTVSSF